MAQRIFATNVSYSGGPLVTVTLRVERPDEAGAYDVQEVNVLDAALTQAAGGGNWGNAEVCQLTGALSFIASDAELPA